MNNMLNAEIQKIGLSLHNDQLEQFEKYYELLVEWNKVMNLTTITEYEEVVKKHFVDSLSIVSICEIQDIETVIDIGTGAGFPGIPLKIMFPHLKITLLDSVNKKLRFLDTVIRELDLANIKTLHGRAEDYAKKKEYREQFDMCVSRAVANLSTLSEYCVPYVKVGGSFISYKSGDIEKELLASQRAVMLLGGKVEKVNKFKLPDTDIDRSFVNIRKVSRTSKQYPRKAGLPSKEPL